jgi:hypothetical protein
MGPQPANRRRDPAEAVRNAENARLEVIDLRQESLETVFFDIAAVVHFLRKVPWAVPTSAPRNTGSGSPPCITTRARTLSRPRSALPDRRQEANLTVHDPAIGRARRPRIGDSLWRRSGTFVLTAEVASTGARERRQAARRYEQWC